MKGVNPLYGLLLQLMSEKWMRYINMLTNYTAWEMEKIKTVSTFLMATTKAVITTALPPLNVTNSSDTLTDDDGVYSGNSAVYKVVVGMFLCLIIFLSLAGNVLVCIAVCTDRRLKRLNNTFIVSLAVADLWVSLIVMTFAVANDVTGRWMFGSVYCNVWISSDVMGSTASILNLCVISLDRYIYIRDPLKYARWMSWKKVAVALTFVWTVSIILSFIPINVGWHKSDHGNETVSALNVCMLEISGTYAVVSSSISFYLPCIVMLALYFKLYMYAREQVRNINSTRVHSAARLSDHKAAVTLGIIMGTFLVCWLPFFILNLIEAYCKCAPIILFQIFTWLGYFNSCLNPIIYSIFNSEFRNAFKKILFPKSCCYNDNSNTFNLNSKLMSKNGHSTTYLTTKQENGSKGSDSLDSRYLLIKEKITAL